MAPAGATPGAARRRFRRLAASVLDWIYPVPCPACGLPPGARPRFGFCNRCWGALTPLQPPLCPGCSTPRARDTDLDGPAEGRCARCVLHPLGLDGARAAVAYEGTARLVLLRAKFGGRPEILAALGSQLARVVLADGLAHACTRVVPVPSHAWARLRRGFDPAREIARPVARALRAPLVSGALVRRLDRPGSAKRWSARRRRVRLDGAFAARARCVRGQRVLLIDDVLTTGATLAACVRALRDAGAVDVRAAVWARTPPPAPR